MSHIHLNWQFYYLTGKDDENKVSCQSTSESAICSCSGTPLTDAYTMNASEKRTIVFVPNTVLQKVPPLYNWTPLQRTRTLVSQVSVEWRFQYLLRGFILQEVSVIFFQYELFCLRGNILLSADWLFVNALLISVLVLMQNFFKCRNKTNLSWKASLIQKSSSFIVL